MFRLVLHSTQEWYDLYSQQRTKDLEKFFDCYLKHVENDWHQTPPVRLALLQFNKAPIVDKAFSDLPWHLDSCVSRRLYLTPDKTLSDHKLAASMATLDYDASTDDTITFTYRVPSRMALVGQSTLAIDVSSPDHDDLDVYTHIFKADAGGAILSNKNIPTPESLSAEEEHKLTQNRLFRYWGPDGALRASQRHVSASKSGKTWKTLSHQEVLKVAPGEIVRLENQLWPTGIVFEAGELLMVKISGASIGVPALAHRIAGSISYTSEEQRAISTSLPLTYEAGGKFQIEKYISASCVHE